MTTNPKPPVSGAASRRRPSPWRTSEALRTYVSGVLGAAGLALALLGGEPDPGSWFQVRLDAAGLLLLGSAAVGGWNFFPKGLRAIRRLKLDMNFLMTAAIIGAVLIGEPLEAAAIAFLFSFSELLERHAMVRARRSVDALLRLTPEMASRVEGDEERRVPASALRKGDRIRVRPGEKIAIDGWVADGRAGVNEANVTGEAIPVPKRAGDPVYAGTVSADGFLEIVAETDAGDTTIDRIARLVREAQGRRSPTETFVKRFARVYTPAITLLAVAVMTLPPLVAGASGLVWFERGLTLLVIACPCALVIATPVTIVSALTSGARHGVLFKGGEFVETLGSVDAMAFDKTGTLTRGRVRVVRAETLDGRPESELLRLAAAVEGRSEHPIAAAILDAAVPAVPSAAEGTGPDVTEFVAVPGLGVTARVDGRPVSVGTRDLAARSASAALSDPALEARIAQHESSGHTVILVTEGSRVVGLISLEDEIRAEAAGVIERLRGAGIAHVVMLTGDRPQAAAAVAARIGVDDVRASLKPADKARLIAELRDGREHGVAMVGDGVNDAPALAEASVGIAMGGAGSPATIEAADVVLMADDLDALPYARRLSRSARRLVRLNIGLALGLKALLALGAVTGVVSLIVAVLVGDMGATIAVTLNAMRLARLGPDADGRRG